MNRLSAITDEAFIKSNRDSKSIKDSLENLGLEPYTDHYRWYRRRCQDLGLEPPVYIKSNGGFTRRYSNDELFVKNCTINTNGQALKRRLISDYGFIDKCSNVNCPSPYPEWAGSKLTLQLDHINGDRSDNRVENLRILCPNCHTQTETFSGKRKSKSPPKKSKCECGADMSLVSKHCRKCANKYLRGTRDKIEWPEVDEVIMMVESNGFRQTGRLLGVSDNSVRKYLLRNGIDFKSIK